MSLKKELGLMSLFSIASGAMISSGLFILPGMAHAQAGPAVFLSYLLGGLLAMTGMLSQAELASAMPKAGGTYFYVKRSMGPAIGTVNGLITWFSLSLKSAFALVGMAAFASEIVPLNIKLIAIVLCLFFLVLNLIGVKEAGRVQMILVLGLFLLLAFYIIRGIPSMNVRNFEPFAPNGVGAVLSSAGFVFVSFGGLLKIASMAEEVKNPGRTIPLAMIFSLIVVIIFYMLVVLVTTGVLGAEELDGSLTPISDGAEAFLGKPGRIALSIAAVLAFISTANAGIMASSRYPLALSRDGLLPATLARINERFGTPHRAIILTGGFMIFSLFWDIGILVKAASTVLILSYIFPCLSVMILRESKLQNYQPVFKAPLYPWVQIIGVVGFALLLFEMGKTALIVSLGLVVGSLFVYWFYGRIRTERESALLHLVERITAKEITGDNLETELKEIIRERDEIIKDRFDRLVEESPVLDIKKRVTLDEFFQLVGDLMADRLGMEPSEIVDLLVRREQESSTVISDGLAIPHIILEGEGKFVILLARCKDGIVFSESQPPVRAVFALFGTRDERNFHLRALSAIAQIVREHDFQKKWLRAKNEQALRDVILLGKRIRTG